MAQRPPRYALAKRPPVIPCDALSFELNPQSDRVENALKSIHCIIREARMDGTDSRIQDTLAAWRNRCDFWLAQTSKSGSPRRLREREKHPLILTGHGLSLRVDKGCLLVRDGLTHYPAERREWRFFSG